MEQEIPILVWNWIKVLEDPDNQMLQCRSSFKNMGRFCAVGLLAEKNRGKKNFQEYLDSYVIQGLNTILMKAPKPLTMYRIFDLNDKDRLTFFEIAQELRHAFGIPTREVLSESLPHTPTGGEQNALPKPSI